MAPYSGWWIDLIALDRAHSLSKAPLDGEEGEGLKTISLEISGSEFRLSRATLRPLCPFRALAGPISTGKTRLATAEEEQSREDFVRWGGPLFGVAPSPEPRACRPVKSVREPDAVEPHVLSGSISGDGKRSQGRD